jgi:carbon monoxide dehydrogenase subunit G
MHLSDQFTISTPPDEAFEQLLDLRNVAGCVPGGEVDPPDDDGVYAGRVAVRLGPMKFSYDGTLRVTEQDPASRTAVIEGSGNTSGGADSARVRSVMVVEAQGEGSLVRIETDLEIRGRAAQMGAGIVGAVSKQMVKQTAKCLEARLGSGASEAG